MNVERCHMKQASVVRSDPEILGGLVRCSEGCRDFSLAFGAPFISGKDSLNNTWREENGTVHSIPGTLLISAIGVIPDARRCVTLDFKRSGNAIALLGSRMRLPRRHRCMRDSSSQPLPPAFTSCARNRLRRHCRITSGCAKRSRVAA